ncbi:hypothetical protein C5Y96_17355 [Blastopirellula marina]|uniref:DUF7939 domain-containing protein n=1 Tax=Blastopirellula marina TaxID=124 RepID=A0A2S8F583_9BACT|nr:MULTISPECIES: BatD family protein [Pirellulaceae]PQO27311.1 hypothetical protein C5Y96_17355 [Blastopirellula marina]RCS47848.1 hypothetical protein DTL36_17380 [Bremerella cremea]
MMVLRLIVWLAVLVSASLAMGADVKPVTLRLPDQDKTFWVGQRIPVFVEIRAKGTFSGATNFSLPQILQSVFVQVGNPVVSSEEHDGDSWFVQVHEFALFTQSSGSIEIPAFSVRYSNHDGFTGPVTSHNEIVPQAKLEVKSPPDRESHGFLVTTDKIDISETWQPKPGSVKQGDIAVRTITQSADQMIGMALAPPPNQTIDGIQVYPGTPTVSLAMERGEFLGTRTDEITYRFDKAGTLSIPEVTYTWWDPDKQQYHSHTLPAVDFEVAAVVQPGSATDTAKNSTHWLVWLPISLALVGLGAWQYPKLKVWGASIWQKLNPPDKVATRQLLQACRTHDVQQAEIAWAQWQSTQMQPLDLSKDLEDAVNELHRVIYGAGPHVPWNGNALAHAFERQRRNELKCQLASDSALPQMNPAN